MSLQKNDSPKESLNNLTEKNKNSLKVFVTAESWVLLIDLFYIFTQIIQSNKFHCLSFGRAIVQVK